MLTKYCFLFFSLFSLYTFGQDVHEQTFDAENPVLLIKNNFQKERLGRYIYVLTCDNKPSLAKIMRDSLNYPFKLNYTETLQFKRKKDETAYWMYFKIKNETDIQQNLILEVDNPALSEIEFFEIRNQEHFSNHNATGSKFEFQTRQIPHRNFLFRVSIYPKEEKLYYVYVNQGGKPFELPLTLFNPEKFVLDNYTIQSWLGLFCGFSIFAFAMALFFYLHLSKEIFVYLMMYILSLIGLLLSKNGMAFQYFWSKSPFWNENAAFLFAYLLGFVLFKILRFFVLEQKNTPFFPKILGMVNNLFLAALVLNVILVYFGSKWAIYFNGDWLFNGLIILHIFFNLVIGYHLLQKPNTAAYSILLATLFLLSPSYYLYIGFEELTKNIYANPLLLYLAACQILFCLMSLTYQIRIFKNEEHLQKLISVNKLIAVHEHKEKEVI